MRKIMAAALLLGLALTTQARGQSSLFGGVDPTKLSFIPVNTGNLQMPIASPSQSGFTSFSLTGLFTGSGNQISNQQRIGISQFPTPAQLPGQGWLAAFNFQRPSRRDKK